MLATSAARAESVDVPALYEALRRELVGIVRAASDDELTLMVAATPAWRVRDVLAHVTGITYDLNRQDLDGDTDRQVARDDLASRVSRYPLPVTDLPTA